MNLQRQHPAVRAQIPVSKEVYSLLGMASVKSGFEREDWEIAAEAIEEWSRRHNPDALANSAHSGYQWKQLFLPDGTLLRTAFGGKNHHCLVEGDGIFYEGRAVSPSGFVNAVGGIRRNAWTCIWLRFPNTSDWKRADTLRSRARPERKPPAAAQAAPAPTRRASDRAPAPVQQGHQPFASPEVRQPRRTPDGGKADGGKADVGKADGGKAATGLHLAAPPARGVQRVGRFRGRAHRTAGAVPAPRQGSINNVADALRGAGSHRPDACPTPQEIGAAVTKFSGFRHREHQYHPPRLAIAIVAAILQLSLAAAAHPGIRDTA